MRIFKWFFLGIYNVITIIPRYIYIGVLCIINPDKGKVLLYKGKPVIPILMITLTLSVYFICIFYSSRWYVQRLKINYLSDDILKSTEILESIENNIDKDMDNDLNIIDEYHNISYISVDFNDLVNINNETVGWILVNNTNVNYSIVQHDDNEYYLKHDFNKNYNINGWVYADYRDDFEYFGNNTIIYAHNMTDRSMFGSLVWCLNESWYKNEDNHFIKISALKSNTVWKIFSIYTIVPEVYYLRTYFDGDTEHKTFLDTIKNRSIYDFGEVVDVNDKILTLSTCSDDGKKRIVIHAKMIKAEYR